MTDFYLNHLCIENCTEEILFASLIDFSQKIDIVMKKLGSVKLIETFWEIQTASNQNILSFISSRKQDESIVIMKSMINSGPFYSNLDTITSEDSDELVLIPQVANNIDLHKFMVLNIFDSNNKIISVTNSVLLKEREYYYKFEDIEGSIHNFTTLSQITDYFDSLISFNKIDDVFNEVKKNIPEIIILSSAEKSSRRHNFKKYYAKIYLALETLMKVELDCSLNNEAKKEKFKEMTTFDISEESNETMKVKRYLEERTFILPNGKSEVFEWHIKIGNTTRIHYYVDKINKKIYIGHCGKHLGTVSYNS